MPATTLHLFFPSPLPPGEWINMKIYACVEAPSKNVKKLHAMKNGKRLPVSYQRITVKARSTLTL